MSRRRSPDEWTHGAACYSLHGCRCDVCRAARSRYMCLWRLSRLFAAAMEAREARAWTPLGLTWPELVARALERGEPINL